MKSILFILCCLIPSLAMAGAYNYSSMDFINQGSAQVGRNYIKNGGGEVNKLGWSTFADAAATTPADGTGGSPNSTWTTTTSSPLRGSGSFLWTKSSGASRQGEGVAYDFVVDSSDKGKVLQIKFDYAIASGTFVDDDMTVWVYDVTNATMIQPAPYKLKNHSLASETFGLEFQTATTSTSYRLILYVPVTTNSANTLKFDNFSIGPANLTRGPPVTDWVSYTPTGTFTNTTYTGLWRRVGDSMEVQIKGTMTGTPGAANFSVDIPSGYTIDTTKLVNNAQYKEVLGTGSADDSGTGYKLNVLYDDTNSVFGAYQNNASGTNALVTQALPFTFGASDTITLTFKVPISGWSSSVIMSSDADTRVVAAQYYVSASTANSSFADDVAEIVDFDTKVLDTHNAATTGAAWKYTAPVKGVYRIYSTLRWANATNLSDSDLILYKNGSQYQGALARVDSGSMGYDFRGSQILELNAGDYVQIYANQNDSAAGARTINTSSRTYIYIEKLSGPAQIAASETVAARYTSNAGTQTIANSTAATIIYEDKDYDTHGAYNTSTGIFTAPVKGKYLLRGSLQTDAAGSAGVTYLQCKKDNNDYHNDQTHNATRQYQCGGVFDLIAGETLLVQFGNFTGATRNPVADQGANTIDIIRIGN